MLAADAGDGTEAARVIASVADPEVSIGAGGRQHARPLSLRRAEARAVQVVGGERLPIQQPAYGAGQLAVVGYLREEVHLRILLSQGAPGALHQTARHDHALQFTGALAVQEPFKDGMGLLSCGPDERAGVEHHGVRIARIAGHHEPFFREASENQLRVDQIARTAEVDERNGGCSGGSRHGGICG